VANLVHHPGDDALTPAELNTAFNAASQAQRTGDLAGAESLYRQILSHDPHHAPSLHALGVIANRSGRPQDAVALIGRSLAIAPSVPEAHYNLAQALRRTGDLHRALGAYQQAIALRPDFVEAWNNLATALKQLGQLDPAIAAFQKAVALRPADIEPRYNLGNALAESGDPGQAIAVYEQALAHRPDAAHVIAALGNAHRSCARIPVALDCYRRSLAIEPAPDVASNLAYTLYLDPGAKPSDILAAHRDWDTRFARPLATQILPLANDRSPGRRLRIGYVSPDLSLHPVGRFMLPILAHHDHSAFEIHCYSDGPEDSLTARLRSSTDVWRQTAALSHAQLADQIRRDAIDILVDLSLHTRHNRLLTFARKPAPVQLSYLAYCGTTGLSAIDFRLTDPYLDPPGQGDADHSERSIRLPQTYWCFQPIDGVPQVAPPPSLATGHVTFASLGTFAKASAPAVAAWLRILQSVAQSRLLVHAPLGPHRDRIRADASALGITPARVEFFYRLPLDGYFQLFSRIDIALDTFPCSGATVICDALWMGVPVITLAGQTAMARSGVSILSNAGLSNLVARDTDEYVSLATILALDPARLNDLRQTLRRRLTDSPLMDAPRFTRNFESALRAMWREAMS
jgi:protein O-GlcNAc transferase